MPQPDDDLIRRAQCYDQEALAEIYDTYFRAVFRYAYFRLGDQTQAEDIASEVFVRMVECIKSYKQRGRPLLAWLYTIAHNLVVDGFHSRSKENASWLEEASLKSDHEQPIHVAERHQELDCLEKAMLHLTEDQRQFILLRFFEECSIADIAMIMGKNERAIRSLQHRALASLSKALEEENCYG